MNNRKRLAAWGLVSLGAVLAGCHGPSEPAKAPPAAGAVAPQKSGSPSLGAMTSFSDSSSKIHFQYPADWKQTKGATAVLTVVAPAKSAGGGSAALFFDVPKVSPFEAALASPKAVADGYVKDTKKNRIPDAKVETKDTTVGGAAAKDVTLSGKESAAAPGLPPAGSELTEEAVAVIHGGKIYIFSCDSDPAGTPVAHAALMSAVQSVQWTQ